MKINVTELHSALSAVLSDYIESTTQKLNRLTGISAEALRKRLNETAPVGSRKKLRRSFKDNVHIVGGINEIHTVYSTEYRLLHLVENGHLTRNGTTRTKGAHFVAKAVDEIIPEYENAVVKAVEGND